MNFTASLVSKLSEKHLLKHEFYQAWSAGTVPMETLRLYAGQYYHHVKAFPRYISATHSNCDQIEARQVLLENLNEEEGGKENHPELWLRFAEGLGESRESTKNATLLPETRELVDSFLGSCRNSYAEGLGALFAYEHQIPEVATFKIDALKKHYAIENESTLNFFEVHRQADVYHTQALSSLLDNLSPAEKELAEKSATIAANHLWKFLDGIQSSMPATQCAS
jgi:pyrroloquinoline-quinone synthase